MKHGRRSRMYLPDMAVGILLAGIFLVGCTGMPPLSGTESATVQPTGTPPHEGTKVAEVRTDFRVRRHLANAWAGASDAGSLPRIDDDVWHDLLAGGLVTTDDSGEGWGRISDCMLIYIFQNS